MSKLGPGATVLLEALRQFVNFVIKDVVLDDARSFFFGASLIALSKPDGGVRPIAVGCTPRRLVAKCASKSIFAAMGELLAPLQVGYGTPLGAEATAHAARTYLSCLQPDQLMLKIDFCNTFNTVRRDVMLPAVLQHAPEIYPLVFASYRNPTHLYFGSNVLESSEGVQQGDPLGPLMFSLTIHLIHLTSKLKVFYLDDGTLGGTADEIVQDLHRLEGAADALGLELNHRKTEINSVNPATAESILALYSNFKCVEPADACLLGSPIGGEQSINNVLSSNPRTLTILIARDRKLSVRTLFCSSFVSKLYQ